MKRFLLTLFIASIFFTGLQAQVSFTNASPIVNIDFSSSMPTTVGTNPSTAFSGAGFEPNPTTAGRLNSNAWAVTGWSNGDLGFGGTQITASTDYTRGSTALAVTTGGMYAFTGSPGSVADPSLMIQPGGGDWAPGTLTLRLQNNGTSNIIELAVAYDLYVRNDQGRASSFNFSYSVDDVIYTPIAGLDYTSIEGADALGWVLVGSTPSRNTDITGLNVAPGGFLYIRWSGADVSGSGSRDEFGLDAIFLTAVFASGNTITTGTVSTTPFVLTDCNDTETGTVDFTSTGTFNAGNIFTAQLSNDIGQFTSPINIGTLSLSGTDPSGTINITIPAGTVNSTTFKIRVVASDPVTIGTASDDFIIVQQAIGGCASAHADHYRSNVPTGTWDTPGSWESSFDGSNWITATLSPTWMANTITIRNGHHITIDADASADQVVINSGGHLEHSSGTFTIRDYVTGDDIDIEAGGIFTLSSSGNPPLFGTGSPTVDVNTGAILRVSGTGLTSAAPTNGVNASNYIYYHQSILEYTLTSAFSTISVIYFPNVNAATIPIFRCSNTGSITVGAASPTTFNGVFESNGAGVVWTSSANKIFRNGIIGSGGVSTNASFTGDFVINGATATLGGTGVIDLTASPTRNIQFGPTTVTTLTSDKSIIGRVAIALDSYIDVGVFNLIVTGQVSNATITSYVRTNSTGTLRITNVGTGILGGKLFPIGRSTINPIFIQNATVTGSYSARVSEPLLPGIVYPDYAVLRNWHISSLLTAPNALISFGYTFPGDCGPSYVNTGFNAEIGVFVSSTWNVHQSGLEPQTFPLVLNTYVVTNTTPINYFNGTDEFIFVVGNNGAILPLDYFIVARAQKQGNNGIISWTIHDADVVRNFEVQRLVNGTYRTIATINPVTGQVDYSFTDVGLQNGTILYRVKVNRLSGDFRYSNTVAIINDSKGLMITSLLPNPVQGSAVIDLSVAKKGVVSFEVYNIAGQPVKKWMAAVAEGSNSITANFDGIPAGVYHILAQNADSRTVFRFVKQ
jgi:hypothetical protein